MRMTRLTDYALRVLMYAAQHPDRLCTIAEIAKAHAISQAHLMKVTHQLAQHGWVKTVRGKGGGLRLAHSHDKINLGAVVRDMEPDLNLVECMGGPSKCTYFGNCGLAHILNDALSKFLAFLDQHTLADVPAPVAPDQNWSTILVSRSDMGTSQRYR